MPRWRAFVQLVLARWREFFREPETIFWSYGYPLALALGLGIAFASGRPFTPIVNIQEEPHAPTAVALKHTLQNSGLKADVFPEEECRARLRLGKSNLMVKVENDNLSFRYDEANQESELARYKVETIWLRSRNPNTPSPHLDPVQDPGNRYIDFLLPGLIATNLMGGGLFGIGFVLVDMRMRRLFKRLLATPMRRLDFLASLLAARLIFLIPEMATLFGFGWFVFGVPIYGNPVALLLTILFGSLAFCGLGLLIGCRTDKTETISGLLNLVMLPMYVLSGVFFSSKRFPDVLQPFIQALPLTQVIDALREVMLEGAGLIDVSWRLAILIAWTVISVFLALRWFRWR